MNDSRLRLSILACLAATGAPAWPALAQESAAPARQVTELQEVVVTGSNILTTLDAEMQASPVEVISAEEIERTGAVSLADVLATNPAITGGVQGEQGSGGRGFINLRGLGTQYTLVLVNGRRLSANDPANSLSIPADAIERVEILKSGASAIYGSDAVAGVINVILKSSAEGMHASVTYGDTTQGGGRTSDVNLSGGLETGSGRFFYLINRMEREEIRARDRDLTSSSDMRRYGGYDERSMFGNPGVIGGVAGRPSLIADPARVRPGAHSLDPADYRPYDPATDLFDTNAVVNPSIISAPTRITVLGNLEQDFLDGRLTFFATGLYWDMTEYQYDPTSNISFADEAIGPVPAGNPYNPFGQDLTDVDYLPIELGRLPRRTEAFTRRLTSGLRADLGSWRIDSAVSWYRSGMDQFSDNMIIKSRLREALNRSGSNAFNPFCNQCNTAAQLDGLLGSNSYNIRFRSDLADVRASGPLFDLPTGAVQAAVGGEYRKEGVSVTADPLTQVAGFVGTWGYQPYDLERSIRSVFAEVRIPLLAPREAQYESPLELSLAMRYENYSDFGSTSNPLATLRYSLFDGQLTARMSYAEAFLAPYLELATSAYRYGYGDTLVDPLTGGPVQAQIYVMGTDDIDPETSTTRNFGLILTPDAVPGLMLSLDYFRIRQNDLVAGIDPQSVLDGASPGTVTRGDGIGPSGQDMIVEAYFYNLGERRMAGYELAANYLLPKMPIGELKLDFALSHLASFEVARAGVDGLVDIAGGYDRNADAFFSTRSLPKNRALLGLSWNRGAWSAASQLNYMAGYDEMTAFGQPTGDRVPSYATTDLQVGYSLGGRSGTMPGWLPVKGLRLTLGAENLFDREVPFVVLLNSYNTFESDIRGRYLYARVGVDF